MSEARVLEQTAPVPPPTALQATRDIGHAPLLERYAAGKALRDKCPRRSHRGWKPPASRRDAVEMVLDAEKGRMANLLPLRHGRMVRSAFTFYRGAALNMAADLAATPATGLRVQACGDSHLCNFGGFATPERRVIVDINELDESLPAPWEWDVKRLAASFVLASRNNGHGEADARDAATTSVRSYRQRMAELSEMRVLDVWYANIDLEQFLSTVKDKESRKRAQKRLAKARGRDVLEHEFPEFVSTNGKKPTIKNNPPLIYHWPDRERKEFDATFHAAFS